MSERASERAREQACEQARVLGNGGMILTQNTEHSLGVALEHGPQPILAAHVI